MRVMYLDGNHQANDSPGGAFVHHRIGALPTMLHPQPVHRRSSSASAAAPRPARWRATISKSTSSSCRRPSSRAPIYFKHINFNLLERPNVTLHVDDGRNFLLMSRKKYDVITADIILPQARRRRIAVLARVLRAGAATRWPMTAW